jgi:hypothetical protein
MPHRKSGWRTGDGHKAAVIATVDQRRMPAQTSSALTLQPTDHPMRRQEVSCHI